MSVKTALDKYFKEMIQEYSKTKQGLPMRPKRSIGNDAIYVGECDDEGWCRWKPMKKKEADNFDKLEELFEIKFNENIKEYYNSYWFLSLEGSIKKKNINLEPVVPGNELTSFIKKVQGYKQAHNNELAYIPIGAEEERGYLIVMENSTGKIKIENHDKGTYRIMANNLEELISSIKPSVIDFD
ncbi:SecY-interacting protein Syd [Clostridium gasigenes]|uniref:SecY-interacting protein Syd n=1 Tax=Clostridium gasigenes TaxID=94869 RepID=UPI001C0B234C|nr:SecY-interacting protein Syd [Clostridium gasigenes]MBU3107988.1 SecY-interacting protein Syd [Clostridium gasigenes]